MILCKTTCSKGALAPGATNNSTRWPAEAMLSSNKSKTMSSINYSSSSWTNAIRTSESSWERWPCVISAKRKRVVVATIAKKERGSSSTWRRSSIDKAWQLYTMQHPSTIKSQSRSFAIMLSTTGLGPWPLSTQMSKWSLAGRTWLSSGSTRSRNNPMIVSRQCIMLPSKATTRWCSTCSRWTLIRSRQTTSRSIQCTARLKATIQCLWPFSCASAMISTLKIKGSSRRSTGRLITVTTLLWASYSTGAPTSRQKMREAGHHYTLPLSLLRMLAPRAASEPYCYTAQILTPWIGKERGQSIICLTTTARKSWLRSSLPKSSSYCPMMKAKSPAPRCQSYRSIIHAKSVSAIAFLCGPSSVDAKNHPSF